MVEKFRAFLAIASTWGASEPSHDLKVAAQARDVDDNRLSLDDLRIDVLVGYFHISAYPLQ
ncbi:hypothetical protein [Bradyrhizobium japonicum]|uniref:hypothetical protein n=1 Tax=Bradyrhizobium japonicum TaxID=375 RepID=UPI0012FE1D85|nr:hypothetical protein [Bradyrhizobium japonicum]